MQASATGTPVAFASPSAKKPPQRSSMCEVARMRGSRASESTSGVEREPGEVHASRRPQRASSSTKARRPRYVSVAGIVCGLVPADLVLLHGFTQTGASWDGVVRELAGRYRALAPDLGAGPWEAELDRLEALAPPAFTLAGYSMGGRLALALALRIPERVRRLVLVSASPGLADAGERAARREADEALATRIEAIGAEAFAREWAAQPLFAGQPPEVAAAAHEDRMRRSAAEHAAQLRGLGTGVMPPLWERLGELAMPVTLVVGERDAKFRAIAERMGFPTVVVPGAGPRRAPRGAGRGRRAPGGCPEPLAAARGRGYPRRPMLRTTRTARRGRAAITWLAEWRLPAPERRAARAERAALRTLALERDNVEHTPWARAAALEAERRRDGGCLLLWDP